MVDHSAARLDIARVDLKGFYLAEKTANPRAYRMVALSVVWKAAAWVASMVAQ